MFLITSVHSEGLKYIYLCRKIGFQSPEGAGRSCSSSLPLFRCERAHFPGKRGPPCQPRPSRLPSLISTWSSTGKLSTYKSDLVAPLLKLLQKFLAVTATWRDLHCWSRGPSWPGRRRSLFVATYRGSPRRKRISEPPCARSGGSSCGELHGCPRPPAPPG